MKGIAFSLGSTIFQTCKIDQNCGINNTICNTTKSQCECRKGYVLSSSKRECLKSKNNCYTGMRVKLVQHQFSNWFVFVSII